MSWDSIVGIVAVIIGTILGYLASYFSNRQQRKWQLDSEYRSWRRMEIDKDMALMFDFIQRYTSLAHAYVEFADSPHDPLVESLFYHTKDSVVEQMRNEKPFPVSLKTGPTKRILEELDEVTDRVVELALDSQKPVNFQNHEGGDMKLRLGQLRELERALYAERQAMISETFK